MKKSFKSKSHLKRNAFFVVAGLTSLYFLYTLNKNKMDNIENIPDKGKKQSTMDKVIFGLLIGGAIGSVLGLTVAPDKGKATRKEIKKRGVKLSEKGREILDENEDAVAVVTNKSKGVIDFFADKILGREKKVARKSSILDWLSDMETIPNEDAEEISQ